MAQQMAAARGYPGGMMMAAYAPGIMQPFAGAPQQQMQHWQQQQQQLQQLQQLSGGGGW